MKKRLRNLILTMLLIEVVGLSVQARSSTFDQIIVISTNITLTHIGHLDLLY